MSAHTSLSGSSPGDGEELEAQPTQIHLSFSGKLESSASLHAIKLDGPEGAVPLEPPALDGGGKSLMAALPPGLPNGAYAVTFRVVSADGHPIEGGFSFEIAAPEPASTPEPAPAAEPEPAPEAADPGVDAAEGAAPPAADEHAGHHPDDAAAPSSDGSASGAAFAALLYGTRILYYAALLSLVGWALWSALRPVAPERAAYWRGVGLRLQALHLAAFAAHVAVQWAELSGGVASASFLDALRETSTGQSWLFTGLLSLAGFPLLFRHRATDGAWALLMIGAKTLRGHAGAFEPVLWSRLADGVHLAAAALWVGGLLALVLLLRKSPEWFRSFAPSFSAAALCAYAALVVTGVVSALLYTESAADIVRTAWGWLLIAKAALAAAVLPVAALLRRRLLDAERRPNGFRSWLRADFALLAAVVGITGVLTHMSPIVERVTFHWHVMGETAHLTADIADLRAGANELQLKIWVPSGEPAPAVSVAIAAPGEPERPGALRATDVPAEAWESFAGFDKYTFVGEVDVADLAQAELRVRIQRSGGAGETLDYAKKLIAP